MNGRTLVHASASVSKDLTRNKKVLSLREGTERLFFFFLMHKGTKILNVNQPSNSTKKA